MGAGHGHRLHYHGHSPVHRAPAHLKLLALVVFMLIVVASPRGWYPLFLGYLGLLLGVVALSGVPAGYLAKRMVIETPFVLFALLVPFIAEGRQVELLGVSVSEPGLWAAWGLLAKGTLGVLASLTLAATTEPQAVLTGLRRLRMPDLVVQIMGFMLRYLDVVSAEMGRMTTAMRSRGCDPRSPRHWPVLARSLGALFIRSYERGERVHLAMLARGYAGTLPDLSRPDLSRPSLPPPRPGGGALMTVPVLEVRGLAHAYPDGHQALFGVDLHVHEGERVALLGPNGAGKTTLVLHLNGILSAGAGTVAVSGLRVEKANLKEIRRRVGVVFQDPDDQLFMASVRQDVAFGPANQGMKGAALERRVLGALEQVGMAEFADRPPHHLSFGQRRRVAVATVLAMEPEILVLDEPSSNLDPASRRELADILRSLDVTVLMVTHDLPYALELCPRSVVLHDGEVVADGATYDLLTDSEMMRRHRLELPFGFDPATIPGIGNLPA